MMILHWKHGLKGEREKERERERKREKEKEINGKGSERKLSPQCVEMYVCVCVFVTSGVCVPVCLSLCYCVCNGEVVCIWCVLVEDKLSLTAAFHDGQAHFTWYCRCQSRCKFASSPVVEAKPMTLRYVWPKLTLENEEF